MRLGYLPQEAVLSGAHSLWEECLEAAGKPARAGGGAGRLEAAMSDADQAKPPWSATAALQHEFERRGGYTYETRIRQTLTGLGFDADDYNRPIPQLSGGQRTRAFLARLLLSDPDLLILDEPTNHLDIQAVEWLEGYLSQWERRGADRLARPLFPGPGGRPHLGDEPDGHGGLPRQLQRLRADSARSAGSCASRVFEAEKERLLKEHGLHQAQHLRAEHAARPRASCAA